MIGSCLFNEFEGFPFGVGAEFRVPLRRTGVFMAHKRAYGVQRDVFACQPRAERGRSVWKTTLYRLSVMPFRLLIDTALAKV